MSTGTTPNYGFLIVTWLPLSTIFINRKQIIKLVKLVIDEKKLKYQFVLICGRRVTKCKDMFAVMKPRYWTMCESGRGS